MSILMIPDHEFQRAQKKGFGSKEWQRWAQKRAVRLDSLGVLAPCRGPMYQE